MNRKEILLNKLNKRNSAFYTTVFNHYMRWFEKINEVDIFFFSDEAYSVDNFKEKEFYKKKLARIEKSIDLIKDYIESTLSKSEFKKMKQEIIQVLSKNTISQSEIKYIELLFKDVDFHKKLIQHVEKNKIFVQDALNALPDSNELSLESYYRMEASNVYKVENFTEKIKRIRVGNNLYVSTSKRSTKVVFFGFLPFKLCGRGTMDIWKKTNEGWKLEKSKMVWIS